LNAAASGFLNSPHDLAEVIEPEDRREDSLGRIDRRVGPVARQETVSLAAAKLIAEHLAVVIDIGGRVISRIRIVARRELPAVQQKAVIPG
jgi:hypothetical protein